MPPSSDIDKFRAVLQRSKSIVAIAGAGLSAASGIPTFRGAGGLWRSYDAMKLVTPLPSPRIPAGALEAQPNAAYLALAALSLPERLKGIAPDATFALITQNVDGLSRRALEKASQSEPGNGENLFPMFEMHGRLFETICTACENSRGNYDSPICPALAGTELIVEKHADEPQIPLEDLPRCEACGGLLRPGVVWFDEIPRHLEEIQDIVNSADLGIIVGTSSTVYPAAGYARDIREHGGKTAVFNLQRSKGDKSADFLFLGPCEEMLPLALFGHSQ